MIHKIEKRNILVFMAISFGLAWPIVVVLDTLWPNNIKMAYLSHCSAMMMPGVACVVVRKWMSKEGFSDCGFVVGNRLPYLAVILACLALWGFPRLVDVLWAGGQLRGYDTGLLLLSVAAFFLYLVPAFGEELGWRGYLLQKLLPMGTRKALLLHGAIWGAWHWPLLFAAALNGSLAPAEQVKGLTRYGLTPDWGKVVLVAAGLAVGMVAMVVVSAFLGVTAGWLRLRFGSLYLVTCWHAYYDYFRDMAAAWLNPGRLLDSANAVGVLVIVAVGICLLAWGRFAPDE